MTNQNHALVASAILPFSAILSLEAPTTELAPDFAPKVWVCVGDFATFDEAKCACYAFAGHPALIAMQVNQCLKAGGAK